MSVGGVGARSLLLTKSLVDMRTQLGDLQRQLATGKKSDTYAGIGLDRGLTVGLRSHLAAMKSYGDTITNVDVRLDLAQSTLSRVAELGREVKAAAAPVNSAEPGDHAAARGLLARRNLRPAQHASRRPLSVFRPRGGHARGRDARPHPRTATARAPASSRSLPSASRPISAPAALAASSSPQPTLTSVQVAEDVAASPFGFKLDAITSDLDRLDRDRPRRRAAGDVGRSRRGQSECRRDRQIHLHAAGRIERDADADRDRVRDAGAGRIHHRRDVGRHRHQSADGADHGARHAGRHRARRRPPRSRRPTISSTSMPPIRRSASPVRPSTPRPRWSTAPRPTP